MIKHVSLFLLFFWGFTIAHAQLFTPEELEIIKLQDQRTFGTNNELITYLDNFNDAVVIRALWALGNIGSEEGVRYASEKLFSNRSEDIRVNAAYALGLLPFESSRTALIEAIITLKDERVIAEALNSIGFVGTQENLVQVSALNFNDDLLKSAQAMSIARFARRNIKSPEGVQKLIELSSTGDSKVLKSVSYAFTNMRSKDLLLPAKDAINSLLLNGDADTRMWAVLANGYISGDVDYLINLYSRESVWQVKTNILNSFQIISRLNPDISANKDLALFLVNKARGEDVYLAVTALKSL